MDALRLAATGWVATRPTDTGNVPDNPIGNRLRWSWPGHAAAGDGRLAPKTVIVERAPWHGDFDVDLLATSGQWSSVTWGQSSLTPSSAWLEHTVGHLPTDITTPGTMPVTIYPAKLVGHPVQAIRFVYHAGQANVNPVLVKAFEGTRCVMARSVNDGSTVYLQAARLDQVCLWTPSCDLTDVKTLDLYGDTTLAFKTVATINVQATALASFAQVAARYPAPSTVDATPSTVEPSVSRPTWADDTHGVAGLRTLWKDAIAESPSTTSQDSHLTNWQALQIALATRWEFAVLCGLGFVDGPTYTASSIGDEWYVGGLAPATETDRVAYRVRDADGQFAPSNVVYLPGARALDLSVRSAPTIQNGRVWLEPGKVEPDKPTPPSTIRASWDMAWGGPEDASIVGMRVVLETLEVSGVQSDSAPYEARGRRDSDPPGAGVVRREETVATAHVKVLAKVAPVDAFDRVGADSGQGNALLPIDHHPQPPIFFRATHNGKTATLTQPDSDLWAPDEIVTATAGSVRIYRRTNKEPARVEGVQVLGTVLNGTLLGVQLNVVPGTVEAYAGWTIRMASPDTGVIEGTLIPWQDQWVLVDIPHGNGPIPTPADGAVAELIQSPTDPTLFAQVDERAARAYPSVITFADPDPQPPSDKLELIEYRAQVIYAGGAGPFGPAVQAIRRPPTPTQPPPFTVTPLGIDAYGRTLVQLKLEVEEPPGILLEVWWADGDPVGDYYGNATLPTGPDQKAQAAFLRKAVRGDTEPRPVEDKRYLFDTLSLPVPGKVARIVTIGIQAVNGADGHGPFMIQKTILPATS